MRDAGSTPNALRLRALVVLLWRVGLRISEALALTETDLDPVRGAVLVRCGKGGKRREVGLDHWGSEQLRPWSQLREQLPIGTLLCVIKGPTAGGPWEPTAARKQLRRLALRAGVRRRVAPHQLRHAHAVEMAHEGVPMVVIQRQLGHANLGITSIYLQGIDSAEIINTVNAPPRPRHIRHGWPRPLGITAAGYPAPTPVSDKTRAGVLAQREAEAIRSSRSPSLHSVLRFGPSRAEFDLDSMLCSDCRSSRGWQCWSARSRGAARRDVSGINQRPSLASR